MKKIINLILITLLALSLLKADASVVMSDHEIKSIIAKQLTESYKDFTDAQVNIQVVALPFKDLTLPDGKVSFVVKPSSQKFMARDLEQVLVYVNDKLIKTFNVPIVAKAYQNVLIASCFIDREKQITPEVVTIKKIEVSNTLGYQLKADSLGKDILAKKAFREGEIIDKRFVKLRPDILRNSIVTVIFNTNNLSVSTEATALSDGVIGDSICTMNKGYNKVYTGKVIGENRVLVKI